MSKISKKSDLNDVLCAVVMDPQTQIILERGEQGEITLSLILSPFVESTISKDIKSDLEASLKNIIFPSPGNRDGP